MVHAEGGMGKTTFGSCAPSPVFLSTERDGFGGIEIDEYYELNSLDFTLEVLDALHQEEHGYQSLVIDTVDGLDKLLMEDIRDKYTDKELSFGKWKAIAQKKWNNVIEWLEVLRIDKDMIIILLAHTKIIEFRGPDVDPFTRYVPDLHLETAKMLYDWCDIVLFGSQNIILKSVDIGFDKKSTRGTVNVKQGNIAYTTDVPGHMAKNRYGLPEKILFRWDELMKHLYGEK